MKLRGKVIVSAVICMALLTACGQQEKVNADDFYQSVNGQWIEEHEKNAYTYSGFIEQQEKVEGILDEYLKELCEKDSLSEVEKKAVILYEQAQNEDKRNQLGSAPIQDLLTEIESAVTLGDLVELYKDTKISYYNTIFVFETGKDNLDENNQVKVMAKTICGAAGSLTKEQLGKYQNLIEKEAKLAGYDSGRAKEIAEHAVYMENEIMSMNSSNLSDFSRYANKGMTSVLSNLPLEEIAKDLGYLEERSTLTCSATHLRALQMLYVQENFEMIRDDLIASVIIKSAPYLSREMADLVNNAVSEIFGGTTQSNTVSDGYKVVSSAMEDYLAEYYLTTIVGEELQQETAEITEEIRSAFEIKIKNADWMSDGTKKRAINKLNAIKFYIGLPDTVHDYSDVTLKTYGEGGNLLSNYLAFYENHCRFQQEMLKDPEAFYVEPLEVNGFYSSGDNSFIILAPVLTMDGCNKDSTKEEKMAVFGITIAHEISHSFDGTGSDYNEDGIYQNWWKAEDKAAYRERINQVKHYFDGMELENGLTLNGEQIMNETYADLAAMRICLDLLSQQQATDYETFFETYARIWRQVNSKEFENYLVENDTHLPAKIRVNEILNQFEEFYETYPQMRESEAFVAEEDRLEVWK